MDDITTAGIRQLMSSTNDNDWVLALTITKGIDSINAESIIYDYIKEIHGTTIELGLFYDLKEFIKSNFDSLKIYTKFCMEIQVAWPREWSSNLLIADVTRCGTLIYTP
tara:strand:+ start:3484 stop:3810 length:327 start_codon:yes stop_codon:yes gene_type:complete